MSSEQKFCPECGLRMDENAKFCMKCGFDIQSYVGGKEHIKTSGKTQEKSNKGKIAAVLIALIALIGIGVYFYLTRGMSIAGEYRGVHSRQADADMQLNMAIDKEGLTTVSVNIEGEADEYGTISATFHVEEIDDVSHYGTLPIEEPYGHMEGFAQSALRNTSDNSFYRIDWTENIRIEFSGPYSSSFEEDISSIYDEMDDLLKSDMRNVRLSNRMVGDNLVLTIDYRASQISSEMNDVAVLLRTQPLLVKTEDTLLLFLSNENSGVEYYDLEDVGLLLLDEFEEIKTK